MISRLSKKAIALSVFALLAMVAGTALGASMHGEYKGFSIVKLFVDNREVESDVPAIIMDGRTLVPARFLAQALGAEIEFDESTFVVDVHTKESPASSLTEGFWVTDKNVGIMVTTPTLRKEAHGAVAGANKRFLQFMVVFKNFGTQDIWISPEYLSIMVGSVKHNFASPTTSDSFRLQPRLVRPNDYAAGIVIFEVPDNAVYELVPGHMLYTTQTLRVPVVPERI